MAGADLLARGDLIEAVCCLIKEVGIDLARCGLIELDRCQVGVGRAVLGLLVDIDAEDVVGVVARGELMKWSIVIAATEQRGIARLRPAHVRARVRLLAST